MAFDSENAESITLDLETCASPGAEQWLDPIKAPSNWKDAAKIESYKSEKLAEIVARAALEPDLCEIVAVGFQIGDVLTALTRADADEEQLIEQAWESIASRRIIGFSILNFDLPVLIRRSQLLGIRCPAVNLDRYRTPHIDLLERLTFNGRLTMRSLAFYCRRFKIYIPDLDDTVTGADVAGLVAAGHWPAIKYHVQSDVTKTAWLAERLGYLRGVRHEESVL